MMRRGERGSSTLEMTLVGIPLIFVLISIFEMSRGMWMYQTMSFAVKNGVRFAVVHGVDCTLSPNACTKSISDIASVIQGAGAGVDPTVTELIFTITNGTVTNSVSCYMGTPGGSPPYGSLSSACSTQTTIWPPNDSTKLNLVGLPLKIEMRTPFYTSLSMFWPGTNQSQGFALTNFYASSQDYIQF